MRIDPALWEELEARAQDELRSANGEGGDDLEAGGGGAEGFRGDAGAREEH